MGTLSRRGTPVERRKRYSRKFQRAAVERMRTCESVDELAKEPGVTRRCLYKWRTKLEAAEPGEDEKAMEVDFLKGALQLRTTLVQCAWAAARKQGSVEYTCISPAKRVVLVCFRSNRRGVANVRVVRALDKYRCNEYR
jgi:transposase-like protein